MIPPKVYEFLQSYLYKIDLSYKQVILIKNFYMMLFNANTHYNIGFIHMELDLFDIAVNNFADAIYSNTAFYEAYYAEGFVLKHFGNIAQAEVDYKRAIN